MNDLSVEVVPDSFFYLVTFRSFAYRAVTVDSTPTSFHF